jgi:hypothetical protein
VITSMDGASLQRVLEATGFFPDGEPAHGLQLADKARETRRGRVFAPDASWRSPSALTVYFKFESSVPSDSVLGEWRREIWNEGFSPLLWVVSPHNIQLFNGFGEPLKSGDAEANRIATFRNIASALQELDALAGRVALETGQFWRQMPQIDRKSSVDQRLLSDLAHLEGDLVKMELDRHTAQALIGRTVFTQYLIDREIVTSSQLNKLCGHLTLPPILRDRNATARLFSWLSQTFNGDMFPPSSATNTPRTSYLARVADFLAATDPVSKQTSFFPYQFDVIPVELISSIYEQFAHSMSESTSGTHAREHGVHYTRLSAVSLVLDEVMDGLTGQESVLDLTCGSGVFLVEALRRLVALQTPQGRPSRDVIRKTLYQKVYGIDLSDAAIRVAAFSLYLAALELDPDPQPPEALKFDPLIKKTLFVGNAHTIEQTREGRARLTEGDGLKKFDLIVGNPPWGFKGKRGTAIRRKTRIHGMPAQPRGEGLDFLHRAIAFSHQKTRFGIILNATPFFSGSTTGVAAAMHVLRLLAPVTLVNLSSLSGWLFATASAPAVVLYARHRAQRPDQLTVVQVPWSASGARTHTFDVSPSDVIRLSLVEVEKCPVKLKAAAVGRRRDLALLDNLAPSFSTVEAQLAQFETKLSDGLTRGSPRNQTRDSRVLKDLELLEAGDIGSMSIPEALARFTLLKAQWPRTRDIYRAPLVIIKEMVGDNARAIAAVSERDLIFTDAFFGVSLPENHASIAHLLVAVLSSSLASWFFTMTASEFAIWKRKLLIRDVNLLPVPDLKAAAASPVGNRLVELSKRMHAEPSGPDDWVSLDHAVCDLYGLDEADRAVVQDGLFRASWQWQAGREASVSTASIHPDLSNYARLFLSVVSGWLSIRNERRMRAEIFDISTNNALRVIRFVLESGSGPSSIDVVQVKGELNDVLTSIGKRLNVKIASALSGKRELRVHGRHEVIIVKPSARRHWMGVCALDDADAVVAESLAGGTG